MGFSFLFVPIGVEDFDICCFEGLPCQSQLLKRFQTFLSGKSPKPMNRNIFVHYKPSCSSLLSTLRDPPKVPYHPHRELCSRMANLLVVPRVNKSRMRDRAFIFQVPLLLNQLPVSTFKISLKTFLFNNAQC